MASKIDIINQALVLLGEDLIADLTGTNGKIADTLYKTARDNLLSSHRWRFAVKKAALTAASGDPVNEYTNHFTLPSDLLLLITTYPKSGYEVYEDKLLTNQSSASIDYVFDPGEKKYPTYFVKALIHQLASDMALPISQNNTLAELQEMKARELISSAKYKDSQGRSPKAIQSRPYLDARH